jgi:copper chaperone CopZ
MKSVEFAIDGMHCGGCVQRVSDALKKVPGVVAERVEVGKARVQLDEGKQSAVLAALDRLGFEARIESGG